MVKPITPQEAHDAHEESIPHEVITAFNHLIKTNWNPTSLSAVVPQDAVAKLAAEALDVTEGVLYDHHWLDVEDLFRAAGWDVEYDKPGYNESYTASFTFRRKKKIGRK